MESKPWIPTSRELPGIGLAAVLGLAAFWGGAWSKSHTQLASDVVLAIALGALVLNTPVGGWLGLAPPTERDDDPYERGLRFTGKWVLRLAIILMGLKIRTDLFEVNRVVVVLTILLFALPTAFFLTHVAARALGLRREMGDLLSIGTMICGASAINALSPVIYARRRDQGLAITAVFLFSVGALLVFYPVATALGLSAEYGGLWAGLAVNDLSSSVAVGAQFSDSASVIAAAAKSVRIMLLGPLLVLFSFLRPTGRGESPDQAQRSLLSHFPKFILGYFLFFGVRLAGDATFGDHPGWASFLGGASVAVQILILAVCAGIGLQIRVVTILELGWKAVVAGGSASLGVAGLSLAMLVGFSRGAPSMSVGIGVVGLLGAFILYWTTASGEAEHRPLLRRLGEGAPLSMREAVAVLTYFDERDKLEPEQTERILTQLYPAIGELQALRTTELVAPIEYRRLVYWESGRGNGSLVGILWSPGATAHIHSHGYDGVGKTIEGRIETTRFERLSEDALRVADRQLVDPGTLMSFVAGDTVHAVRNVTDRDAIHVHYYGPEEPDRGERFEPWEPIELGDLAVGDELRVTVAPDVLPKHMAPADDEDEDADADAGA